MGTIATIAQNPYFAAATNPVKEIEAASGTANGNHPSGHPDQSVGNPAARDPHDSVTISQAAVQMSADLQAAQEKNPRRQETETKDQDRSESKQGKGADASRKAQQSAGDKRL